MPGNLELSGQLGLGRIRQGDLALHATALDGGRVEGELAADAAPLLACVATAEFAEVCPVAG